MASAKIAAIRCWMYLFFAPLGMPSVGYPFDGLRVLGVEEALLGAGSRIGRLHRKADVRIELHKRQSPSGCEPPYGGVVGHPRVVPVGAEDDDRRFAGFRAVVFRFRVVLECIAFAEIAFDHVVERRGVVAPVEGGRVVGVLRFQSARTGHVAVVDLHDDESVEVVQLFGTPECAFGHAVGGVGDRFAADGPVDRTGAQLPAADLEPAVLRRCERGSGEEDVIFQVVLCRGVSAQQEQRKQQSQYFFHACVFNRCAGRVATSAGRPG